MKKLAVCAGLITVLYLMQSCAGNQVESSATEMVNTTPVSPSDAYSTSPAESSIDETTQTASVSTPVDYSNTQTFDSIREMKLSLADTSTDLSLTENTDINSLIWRELTGLDSEYSEDFVEWSGGGSYFIYYTNGEYVTAFMPFSTEAELSDAMNSWLSVDGTYESLSANERISDIVKNDIDTELGTMYECTYNTDKVEGLKTRYHEYTDEGGRTYILSQSFMSDGSLSSNALFVFDGEASFMCSGNDPSFTMNSALSLISAAIE